MAVLQYGDSFFPSGSACFSWGTEFLSENAILTTADDVKSFVRGQLYARWAKFDRPVVIAAHKANLDLGAVSAVDNQVDIQTPSAEFRAGSRRLGRAMLTIFAKLGRDEASAYQNIVLAGSACGHLAPMQGFLWATAGLDEEDAVALSLHTFCVGLLSAAIRLGCLSHIEAQMTLEDLRHEGARIAQTAVCSLDEISSCGFESEIAVMRHAKQATRMFSN
jgi:urease accessory protein